MNNSLVSIIVPIYKVELFVDECISSLVSQTHSNIEIILVDDGSPDKCPEICDQWAKKDNRIKVIHKENGGVSSARNAGLNISTGKYVTFVDGDDWVDQDYVEYLLNLITKYPDTYLAFNNTCYNIYNKSINKNNSDYINSETAMIDIYIGNIDVAVWNKMYCNCFLN